MSRRKIENKMKVITICVTEEDRDFLQTLENQSEFIREAIKLARLQCLKKKKK
jgi:hypothetical protein